jgi:hypothetical protein
MNNHSKKLLSVAAIIGVFVSLSSVAVPEAIADDHKSDYYRWPVVYSPDIPVFGMTYGQWAAKWWQWEFSLPTSENPWFDSEAKDGIGQSPNAGIGQSGPVYFLTGILTGEAVVKRTITVPAGKAFFFPIYNAWCDNVDVDPPKTFKELQECAASYLNVSELHVSIDGKQLKNLYRYRVKSPPFCDWFPSTDNVYQTQYGSTFTGWTCPVASDGYWLMLAPLAIGNHTINFGGTSGSFTLDVTYYVNVIKP